jgi:flap endonuclease-1
MGVNLKDILVRKEVSIPQLAGKNLVVDGNNMLYQFLATIRQADGTPLKDSHGNITSHLNGLFHRTTKLMHYGIKPAFVFDGEAPELKRAERERRAGLKKDAQERYDTAKKEGDIDAMKKYGMRTSRLTREMIAEAVELINALGLPVVMAPSEGEAQAAFMVKNGDIYAEISQDYDCLLFGVPRMVQNLTITERKKKKDRLAYETVKPCMLELEENLKHIGISREQLIALGMLVGTDYDVGGIKGIGPKKALDLVKRHGEDFKAMFTEVKWDDNFSYPWTEVFNLFMNMPVKKDYRLQWDAFDQDNVMAILCDKHDFSNIRVQETLRKLDESQAQLAQKGLGDFF